jgi:hypothetical protein
MAGDVYVWISPERKEWIAKVKYAWELWVAAIKVV